MIKLYTFMRLILNIDMFKSFLIYLVIYSFLYMNRNFMIKHIFVIHYHSTYPL
jgi:hypothetical protein